MITSPARARLLMPSFQIFFSPQTYAISVSTVILPKRNAKLGGGRIHSMGWRKDAFHQAEFPKVSVGK